MLQRNLSSLRRWVSGIVFVMMSLWFLDVLKLLPDRVMKGLVAIQFIPSLMKTLAGTLPVFIPGFILVLCLTLLFGRVYCSFLCPLGGLMDLVIRLRGRKKRFYRSEPWNRLRYLVLALTILVFLSGSLALVNVLDPFSIFGRIMVTWIRPVVVAVNNALSFFFELSGVYAFAPVHQLRFPFYLFVITGAYLVLIVLLSLKKGRLYCNTLCPVGTLLGFVAKKTVFRLAFQENTCTGCGLCERACKAGCIDSKKKYLDPSRCVSCFNCLSACPENSMKFSVAGHYQKTGMPVPDKNRRNLIRMALLLLVGLPGTVKAQVMKPLVFVKNRIPVRRNHPVTPPGSISIRHFTDACTACYLCVSHCPGKVIKPGFAVFGKEGVLMPHLSYTQGYCNFACTICGDICPSGAIRPLNIQEKKQVQVGKVVFIRENCIVITQKTECGACSEHCPTKAVNMVLENNLRVPFVKPDLCVGCGACEFACPSLPHKSIYVDGNPVHQKALKPEEKRPEARQMENDFPF